MLMGNDFSPHEVVENILYVIDQLQARIHDSATDIEMRNVFMNSLKQQLINLDKAVNELSCQSQD